MAKTPGFGERVGQALKTLGYWPNGRERPDYARFGLEHGFHPGDVYRWWSGETPRGLTLLRFAASLKVSPEWLLGAAKQRTGLRRLGALLLVLSTGGGVLPQMEPQPPWVALHLIGTRLSRFWPRVVKLLPVLTPCPA